MLFSLLFHSIMKTKLGKPLRKNLLIKEDFIQSYRIERKIGFQFIFIFIYFYICYQSLNASNK